MLSRDQAMQDDCIISPLRKDKDGYPKLKHQGRQTVATRLLWHIMFGDIPAGMLVLHKCDNSSCVNPAHLYLGTFEDNMQDKVARLRVAGDNHPKVKIVDSIVPEIVAAYLSGAYTQAQLAEKYGISQSQVSYYVTGKRRTAGDNR